MIKQLIPVYEYVKEYKFYIIPKLTKVFLGYNEISRELPVIEEFSTYYNEEGDVDESKCILKTEEGWIEVNHTFEELQELKRIKIKGYGKDV